MTVAPIKVWVMVFPGFQLLDATGPAQVFATANDEEASMGQARPYTVTLVSMQGGLVASSSGITVLTEVVPKATSSALRGGTLMVVGGQGVQSAIRDKALIAWIVRAAPLVARCCSVCTGTFLLAQAGLLDQRHAVTHWDSVEALKRYFPAVLVQDDAIYLKDGHIYTSAGVTSGIDLSLSLLEEDHGHTLPLRVAKQLVVYVKRPGGQRQFSSALLAQSREAGLVSQLATWLKPRLHQPIDVERMAASLSLTPRTLHRRLREEADVTPAQLLHRMRLETACGLLESGRLSLKQVASKSGFGTEYNLRRAFVLKLGVVPSDYRARFA
jgi:transcriptional regulator GlxA family with amidase domain